MCALSHVWSTTTTNANNKCDATARQATNKATTQKWQTKRIRRWKRKAQPQSQSALPTLCRCLRSWAHALSGRSCALSELRAISSTGSSLSLSLYLLLCSLCLCLSLRSHSLCVCLCSLMPTVGGGLTSSGLPLCVGGCFVNVVVVVIVAAVVIVVAVVVVVLFFCSLLLLLLQ